MFELMQLEPIVNNNIVKICILCETNQGYAIPYYLETLLKEITLPHPLLTAIMLKSAIYDGRQFSFSSNCTHFIDDMC